MTEGWKIALFTVCVAIISLIIGLFWPQIYSILWGKHSDTNVFIVGYEHSYWIEELKKEAPKRAKITIKPIKFPKGISNIENVDVPLILRKWDFPKNVKLLYIVALNKGEGVDKNITIDISFPLNKTSIISSGVVNNKENVQIIQGGNKNSTRVIYKISELFPNTRQSIELFIKGKELDEVKVWSGKETKEIKKVFIFDIIIEPDKNYIGPSPLDSK